MDSRKKLGMILILVSSLVLSFLISLPTWAEKSCGGVGTTIIECNETGSGAIGRIALDVIELFSVGVGILGVIGITVVGIQYMTAGGNEEKTRKAKRRMFEIVIGLVAYAMLFGFIQWLGTTPDEGAVTESNGSFESTGSGSTKTSKGNKSSKNGKKTGTKAKNKTDKNGTTAAGKKVLKSAQKIAEQMDKLNFKYTNHPPHPNTFAGAKSRKKLNCSEYVSFALQDAGLMSKGKTFWLGKGRNDSKAKIHHSGNLSSKKFKKTYVNASIKSLVSSGKLVPGDIVGHASGPHTMIFKEKKKGKYYFYSVNGPEGNALTTSRVTKKTYPGTYKIFVIIHPK